MRKVIYIIITILFVSCSKEEPNTFQNQLIGKWNLIEVYADPGDGSGTYNPVTSEKYVEFLANGTVKSNGPLCNLSIETNEGFTGTYSIVTKKISGNDCQPNPLGIRFDIVDNYLIINFPCIEGCGEKYEKE